MFFFRIDKNRFKVLKRYFLNIYVSHVLRSTYICNTVSAGTRSLNVFLPKIASVYLPQCSMENHHWLNVTFKFQRFDQFNRLNFEKSSATIKYGQINGKKIQSYDKINRHNFEKIHTTIKLMDIILLNIML
jgi:hypothetical protein